MLAWGACHPKGESEEFDGLFLKQSEISDVAKGLCGKPIYVEHDTSDTGQVGKIHHAWEAKDKRLNVLFETNPECFEGTLASRLIQHGVCGELSLGHTCKINYSNEALRVQDKQPVEVSIVQKGDRPNTTILGWTPLPPKQRKTEYILQGDSKGQQKTPPPTMSTDSTPVDTPPVAPTESASSTDSSLQNELLLQLKEQTTANAALRAKQETAQEQMAELTKRVEDYQSVGQKRRQEAIDGAVKDWVAQMVKTHKSELGPYEQKLTEMIGALPAHDDADSVVSLLACAAAGQADSTSKLNKAYQDLKSEQDSNKRLKVQMEAGRTPAFSQTAEKFNPPPTKGPTPPTTSDAFQSMFGAVETAAGSRRGGGMAAINPGMYSAIRARAATLPRGSAMQPHFDMSMFSKNAQSSFRE
jgi:hypothetical protein